MRVGKYTSFDHAKTLRRAIEDHGAALLSPEGSRWMLQRFGQVSRIMDMERRVLRLSEATETDAPETFVPQETPASVMQKIAARLRRRRIIINLWEMGQRETYYEETRAFFQWLEYIEQLKPIALRVIDEDFEDLANRIEVRKNALLQRELPGLGYMPLDLEILIAWLPVAKWKVPLLRGRRLVLAAESIPAEKIVGILRRNVVNIYREELKELLEHIEAASTVTKEYLDTLYSYLQGESLAAEELDEVYHRRAKPMIDRLYGDLEAAVLETHGNVTRAAAEVFDTLADLRHHRWFNVKRKYLASGLGRHLTDIGEARQRLGRVADKGESRFSEWVNENIKPAMGITQRVKIQVSAAVLDPVWTKTPDVPEGLAEIMLDRRNPSLLIVPDPVTETMKAVKQFYRENGYGSLLFTTDHLAGSFGMIGYLLSIHFKGEKYRIYRQSATVPIRRMAEFEENVIFIDNFEKMLLLDEDHQPMARELIEQITTSRKLFIVAVNQTVAEHLKGAIPGFSRFLYELHFGKYEFSAFKRIIEKRMVISGYQFEFVDENAFWSKLYAVSSGIPGVALRIFLRCIVSAKGQNIVLDYALPSLKDVFAKLGLDELLLLKKIYMHPAIDIEFLAAGGNGVTRTMASNLQQVGILIAAKNRYSVRPELYGALRDYLMQTNLV